MALSRKQRLRLWHTNSAVGLVGYKFVKEICVTSLRHGFVAQTAPRGWWLGAGREGRRSEKPLHPYMVCASVFQGGRGFLGIATSKPPVQRTPTPKPAYPHRHKCRFTSCKPGLPKGCYDSYPIQGFCVIQYLRIVDGGL